MRTGTRLWGYGLILASTVLFATYGIWSRYMGDSFGPFFQAWARSLIVVLILLPVLALAGKFRKIVRRDWPALAVYIGFCVCTQVPVYYAYNHAPIGTVQLIFYSSFVIAAYLVGWLYLGERITRVKLAAMALAFLGLVLMFGTSVALFAPLALALAAVNGAASGGEVSTSKKLSLDYSPGLLVFWGWLFTFLTHLPISLLIGEPQPLPQLNDPWLYLTIYAACNALAFWLVISGFRYVDASIGSLVGLLEIVFTIVFGAILFHEGLTWNVLLATVVIIAAAMLPDALNIVRGKRGEAVEPVREL